MCESPSSLMTPSPSPPRPSRPPGQPPPEYKHFCRVCNKGFTCGSALGGHMRAHGASDVVDGFGADDDSLGNEASARWYPGADDQLWDAVGTSATHAYALRANPNRLIRSCQVCKNCGKEFTSWELFLQHAKCNSEDEEGGREVDGSGSLRSLSPPSDDADGEEDPAVATAWSKGKRSRRVRAEDPLAVVPPRVCALGEEEDLANCLVMLSSSSNVKQATGTETYRQEPCTSSAIKERDGGEPILQLQPISFFTPVPDPVVALPTPVAMTSQYISPASRGVFECKACKKVFTSHQALGGHRASHKKVKGCFASKLESNVTEPPARHSTITDPNNVNGKAAAVDEATASVSMEATRIHATAGVVDTNIGTTGETSSSLSMALTPIGHNQPATMLTPVAAPCNKKNAKMHECSVCHRLFTSGQALGGHKRCHWLTSNTGDPCNPVATMIPPLSEDLVGVVKHHLTLRPLVDAPDPALDLTIAANSVALAAATMRQEAGSSSFRLDVAPVDLQPLAIAAPSTLSHRKKAIAMSSHATDVVTEEDEADSTTAKRAKLSDLKDVVSMDGEPTEPWLQVGIGSLSAGDDS